MSHVCLLLGLLLALAPPLTDEQRDALDYAVDGRDHQDQAFATLLEHVRGWPVEQTDDEPIRLTPDFDAMRDDPARYRGDLCRIEGRLEQQHPLSRPYDDVAEWFVRDAAGRPVLVFVATPPATSLAASFVDGDRVTIDARFYKRVEADTPSGLQRYAAFVGAHPRRTAPATAATPVTPLTILVPVLAVMLVTFAILLIQVRRQRGRRARSPVERGSEAPEVDDSASLPEDPVDAMHVLRDRADRNDP